MIGMILAAGLGTRLRPLTDHLPKPAVPVANRPLASYAAERLRAAGAREVRANGHYHADVMCETFARIDPAIRFYREDVLLGTGGGLRNALSDVDEEVVVMNGDVLFDVDLARVLAVHRAADAFATLVVRPDENAEAMGAVRVDGEGRVRKIGAAPDVDVTGTAAYAFTGVHVFSPRALRALPSEGCIVRRGYHRYLAEGERVLGVVDLNPWADLGTHAAYLRTNVAIASGAWPAVPRDARGVVHPSVQSRAVIRDSVVGEGAHVADHVTVERCVIWPGAYVVADVRDAIVTPTETIVP